MYQAQLNHSYKFLNYRIFRYVEECLMKLITQLCKYIYKLQIVINCKTYISKKDKHRKNL